MTLYLVQHGISASKDVDPAKGLTPKGREETERIAHVAADYGVSVDKIAHSGKTRALQTAEIFHDILHARFPLEEIKGIAPMDDVREFAGWIDFSEKRMLVGHLPFMERLVALLTAGNPDIKVYEFQNSGIVCLETDKENAKSADWYIKWTLNPKIS